MGLYVKNDKIARLLHGKVNVSDDPNAKNALTSQQLADLVDDAESQVELDLSPRYAVPFVAIGNGPFDSLPRSTKRLIRLLVELMGQIRVLETSFGAGSAVNGSSYTKPLQDRYDAIVKKAVERAKEDDRRYGGFAYPPLLGIALAWHNQANDDGFGGMVLSASMGSSGDFAARQIHDPSQTFFGAFQSDDEGSE